MEKISVIIPVYNAEKTIEKCVDSILQQSIQDFRIYLVDDNSTDDSWALINKIALKDKRIYVFRQETNKGPSAARNIALDIANGEWINFIDSDDYIEKNFFEELLKVGEEADIVISSFVQVDTEGKYLREHLASSVYEANTPEEALATAYGGKDDLDFVYNLCCNKLYRKRLFKNVRFPEGRLQEDAYVMPYLIYNCTRGVKCAEKAIYYYVDNSDSVSYQAKLGIQDFRRRNDLLYLYENHIELYMLKNNKLFFRSRSNFLQNVIAIYRLHYKNYDKECRSDFKKIHQSFVKQLIVAIKEKNPYLSVKMVISFGIFVISPTVYLKIF